MLETEDGSKEATTVSRQQALAAADAVSLDLVQGEEGDPDIFTTDVWLMLTRTRFERRIFSLLLFCLQEEN